MTCRSTSVFKCCAHELVQAFTISVERASAPQALEQPRDLDSRDVLREL